MALRQRLTPALPLFALAPALVLLPVLLVLIHTSHAGGVPLIGRFLTAALHPSLNPAALNSLWRGLQTTLFTALSSWMLSSVIGVVLGALGSRIVWTAVLGSPWPATVVRRLLSPIRAVHELLWGLLLLQLLGLNAWVAVVAITLPYAALMARVVADQIDSHPSPALAALRGVGASPSTVLISALVPAVRTALLRHIGHRLDCSLRSAVLLGVFGLGGLGTDLMLSLQSLQFEELWSGLWVLAAVMILLDWLMRLHRFSWIGFPVLLLCLTAGRDQPWDSFWFSGSTIPSFQLTAATLTSAAEAFQEVNWPGVIGSTVLLSVMAACIATALPPLQMMLWPGRLSQRVHQLTWLAQRLLSPPLTAILLMMVAQPSLSLAALALGLHHGGVMGRVLADELTNGSSNRATALMESGASPRISWLYGPLTESSRSYLAYATYRIDVILRDTATVGLVGGAGLGWELIEAISSFHGWLIGWLVIAFAMLTLAGESLSERILVSWNCKAVPL